MMLKFIDVLRMTSVFFESSRSIHQLLWRFEVQWPLLIA